MRMQRKSIDEPVEAPRFFGRAAIVGDNAISIELQKRLNELGVDCLVFDSKQADQWPQQLEAAWQDGPLPHLFICSPHDDHATISDCGKQWNKRRQSGINAAFWLCQKWMMLVNDAGLIQDCSLVATPNLGGDFGFTSKVTSVEGGAIAGLIKAIIIECWMAGQRRLNIKLVDLAADMTPKSSVDAMFTELSYGSYDTEVGYDRKGRSVVRAVPMIRRGKSTSIPKPSDVWICTGGARGITSFVAEAIAKRYKLRLNLLGITALMDIPDAWRTLDEEGMRRLKLEIMQQARNNPAKYNNRNPLKVWQDVEKALEIEATLQRMRSQGIEVDYHACDCSDASAVAKVVNAIRQQQGPIHGILHGAGIGQDSRFERKQPIKVNECFAAKMDGPFALLQNIDTTQLKHFIGFGSISGRFGANGHTDYSAANDGLVKVCDWLRTESPSTRSIGFHWHAWGDIGMATKPETKLALESIGMQFMPAEEGLRHLIEEIECGSNETEVLITDDRYHRAFYPAETVEQEGAVEGRSHTHAMILPETFKSTKSNGALQSTIRSQLNPLKDPFLIEHCLKQRPLLPIVVDVELLVEASIEHTARAAGIKPIYPIQLDDVVVHAPLKFFCDEVHSATVHVADLNENASLKTELRADALNRQGKVVGKDKLLCEAIVRLGTNTAIDPIHNVDREQVDQVWFRPQFSEITDQFHSGAPFRLMHRFAIHEQSILVELTAPSLVELSGLNRNATGWRVPSAILDTALYACGILAWQAVKPSVCLPTAFDTLRIPLLPRPGRRLIAVCNLVKSSDEAAWFDFDVIGEDGTLFIAARNYRANFLQL
jgi:NAD(P)-dependent dehydrogenase (short-subunit alcohol dehydrogenase family)